MINCYVLTLHENTDIIDDYFFSFEPYVLFKEPSSGSLIDNVQIKFAGLPCPIYYHGLRALIWVALVHIC